MPQFLVEDVIAETCDETAIMGEWNLYNFSDSMWSEFPKWNRWQIGFSYLENKIKMSQIREYF